MLVIWGRESWFCPSRGWCLPAMSIGGSEWRASYKIGLLFPVRTGWFQVTITRICSLYIYYLELDLGLGILGAFRRRNPSTVFLCLCTVSSWLIRKHQQSQKRAYQAHRRPHLAQLRKCPDGLPSDHSGRRLDYTQDAISNFITFHMQNQLVPVQYYTRYRRSRRLGK